MSKTRPLEKKSSPGETLLHSAIREAKSVEEIETFINKHKKSMHKMAQMVNNKGELPLFMIYSTPFTHQEQVKLQTLLLDYTLPDSYLDFSSGIGDWIILGKYSHLKGTALEPTYDNLVLGCKAVQAARKLFSKAATHPEVNDLNEFERCALDKKIGSIRKKHEADEAIIMKQHNSLNSHEKNIKRLHHTVTFFTERGFGNCFELSCTVLKMILDMNSKKVAEIWQIPTADHVFVIIDPHTPHAVFCDALLGNVFPASELEQSLRSYYYVNTENSFYNIFPKFNPEFDYIEHQFSIDPPVLPDKCIDLYTSPLKTSHIYVPGNVTDKNIDKPYMDGLTPLALASEKKWDSAVETLLARKADPEAKSDWGDTALIKAAASGGYKIIKRLLEAKAHTETTDNKGQTPLLHAVASGNYEAAKILLESKANPNHSRFYDNRHPLLFSKNNKQIENLLVEHNAILKL